MTLVAYFARSCAVPGVEILASSSLLLAFAGPLQTSLAANFALTHLHPARTKAQQVAGPWKGCLPRDHALDWARSWRPEAAGLGEEYSFCGAACPVKEEERRRCPAGRSRRSWM